MLNRLDMNTNASWTMNGARFSNRIVHFGVAVFVTVIGMSAAVASELWPGFAVGLGALSENEAGNAIAVDNAGNVYVTGLFRATMDFDPGPGTAMLAGNGGVNCFALKLNASGGFEWAWTTENSTEIAGEGIAVDDSGNVYVTGNLQGSADMDPGPGVVNVSSAGYMDMFLVRLDTSGNLVWAKAFGSVDDDRGQAVAVDASGNVLVTGNFSDTVDFDPGPGNGNRTSSGFKDIFVLKLDSSGDLVWVTSVGGGYQDEGHAIASDAAGNILLTGEFRDTVDFDPGLGVFPLSVNGNIPEVVSDVFVLKLDSSGGFVWAGRMGGGLGDIGRGIAVDPLGNIYTAGIFGGVAVDFDPGTDTSVLRSNGPIDFFVQKLDASCNFLWAKGAGGPSYESANAIAVDALGNAYIAGAFIEKVDFDPGPGEFFVESNSEDFFLLKLGSSGAFNWAYTYGQPNVNKGDRGFGVAVDADGSVYSTGYFSGSVDFDPGPITRIVQSAGGYDIFVYKLIEPFAALPTSSNATRSVLAFFVIAFAMLAIARKGWIIGSLGRR